MIAAPDIASIDAWLVRLPLRQPLRFQSGAWSDWNYVVVRVRAVDGREAGAFTFIGEVPLDLMVTELCGPALIGSVARDLRTVAEHCARAAGPALSDIVRPAASLVEVCLWDLASREARVPLWRLLRATPVRDRAPVMVVEHRRDGETPATFAERVLALDQAGVRAVKIKHYGDLADTTARLDAVRDRSSSELEIVVDVGWAWPDLDSAVREARVWRAHRLAWIEDPFPPEWVDEAARLREAAGSPVGIGDAVTSIDLARRLIEHQAVDVLRVDVTTMGGIAGVEGLAALADAAGITLSPEIFAEVHQHLAFALPSVRGVEVYSADSGVWRADVFVRPGALSFDHAGCVTLPTTPGSGLEIDWGAIEQRARRASRYPPR